MVVVRFALLVALGCAFVPSASCLSLPPQPAGEPPLPLAPPRRLHRLLPLDYRTAGLDTPQALTRLEEAQLLRELEDPTSPAAYRLQQIISQAAEEAVSGGEGGISDVPSSAEVVAALAAAAAGGARGEEPWADPRYYVLDDYLSRADEAGSSTDTNANNLSTIRKVRNSLDTTSSSSSNNNKDAAAGSTENTNTGVNKRTWPHGFSRRRSGLSLSIDASMKVLREALFLEIARKKQRQQLQRAQHNKAILNSIGKRDVSAQLRTPTRDYSSSSSFSSSSSPSTPTLAERN